MKPCPVSGVRILLIIEYDGTRYSGFQYQVNAPSIQAELEMAVQQLTGERVRVAAAGRTDAGVHAVGQVIALDTRSDLPVQRFVSGMNFHLPRDVAVRSSQRVAESFDPRRDAVSRRYRYVLLNRTARAPLSERIAALVTKPLKLDRMVAASKLMVGTHDFVKFAGPLERSDASTVRNISEITIEVYGERIEIDVEGNAFLPHQVRRMVGALVDVGLAKMTIQQVSDLLDGDEKGPHARSMPPQGLCLVAVRYPEHLAVDFE